MTETVLIVGAGPVGLTAAVELWRQGVHARIINKADDFSTESRAIAINPVTLSLLEASNITEKLIETGLKVECSYIHFEHGGVAKLNFRNIDSKYQYMLSLPQSRTERILNAALEDLGGRVEHGTELDHLEQVGDVVRCHVTSRSGASVIEARTVIGADGAHSVARKCIGVDFPGDALDGEWTLTDVRMEWKYPNDEFHGFIKDDGFVVVIPLGDGVHRFVGTDEDLERSLPCSATIKEEIWRSKFSVHHRQATTYQVGRVFLAGDAAHVHSPVGGRGMNLGMKDAVTLARLLIEGREAEYTSTCHPDGKRTVAAVRRSTMAVVSKAWWMKRIMGFIMPLLLKFPPFHRFVMNIVTTLR